MKNILIFVPLKKNGSIPTWASEQIDSLKEDFNLVIYESNPNRKSIYSLIKIFNDLNKLKGNDFHAIHCLWGGILGLITSIIFIKNNTIISFCGSDLLGNYNKYGRKTISGKISRLFSIISSYLTKKIIIKASFMKKKLPKSILPKIHVLPNGVNQKKFFEIDRIEAKNKLNLEKDIYYILFLNKKGPVDNNRWVKNFSKAEEIEKTLPKNFKILYANNIEHKIMRYYYSASEYLLITSLHEGSSNVLKEALFCNCKIISSVSGDAIERLSKLSSCLVSDNINEIKHHITKYYSKYFDYSNYVHDIEINFIKKKLIKIYNFES